MKIRKLYNPPSSPMHMVVETVEGRFLKFFITPFRKITEKDLSPLPGFVPNGNNGTEAFDYMYRFYGFEKAEEE